MKNSRRRRRRLVIRKRRVSIKTDQHEFWVWIIDMKFWFEFIFKYKLKQKEKNNSFLLSCVMQRFNMFNVAIRDCYYFVLRLIWKRKEKEKKKTFRKRIVWICFLQFWKKFWGRKEWSLVFLNVRTLIRGRLWDRRLGMGLFQQIWIYRHCRCLDCVAGCEAQTENQLVEIWRLVCARTGTVTGLDRTGSLEEVEAGLRKSREELAMVDVSEVAMMMAKVATFLPKICPSPRNHFCLDQDSTFFAVIHRRDQIAAAFWNERREKTN